jgi:uncharacterized damage-inducible protein DinB
MHHFATMAYNNAWANHRLLGACCRLSQADFIAARTSFFPSLKATLNHILTVDWYYVDALERSLRDEPPNPDVERFYTPPEPYADCAGLARAQRMVDRRLIDLCVVLTDADLLRPITVPRRGCSRTSSSTRSTIAGRRTRCSPAPPSRRRSSTNSSAPTTRRCARPTSPRSASPRR